MVCKNCGQAPKSEDVFCTNCGEKLEQNAKQSNIDETKEKFNLTFRGCSVDDWTAILFFSDNNNWVYYKDMIRIDLGGFADIECEKISENQFSYSIVDEHLNRSNWNISFYENKDSVEIEGSIEYEVPELWEHMPDGSYELQPVYNPEVDSNYGYREYIIENISRNS